MSLDATVWAWKQRIKRNSRTSRSAVKIVLVSLADRAGEEHTCYPSIARLECDTELNRKTILNALKYLSEIGLIQDTGERKGRTKQVKVYQLIGVVGREAKEPKNGTLTKEPKLGTVKESQIRNSTENGTVPNLPSKSPKYGTPKQTQIRDSELITKELPKEPLTSCASEKTEVAIVDDVWTSFKGKKLKGSRRKIFETLWEAFSYKKSRSTAIDEFLKHLAPKFGMDAEANRKTLKQLLGAIKNHVSEREKPENQHLTPIYFERWISKRRWEDDFSGASSVQVSSSPSEHQWITKGFKSFNDWESFVSLTGHLTNLKLVPNPSDTHQELIKNTQIQINQIPREQPTRAIA